MKNCFLIVNYNDYKSTKHLVDNILDYACIDEILIVDNNSNTDEKELLKTIKHSKVNILFNESNMGYSIAINVGTRHLIEKYDKCNLIISNSDIVIMSEDDLVKLIDLLNDERIGLVGPQLLELGDISRGFKSVKPLTDTIVNIPVLKNFIGEKCYLYDDEFYESEVSFVDIISSSFFLISSEILQRINYLDENIFLYYEDFILAHKIRNLGLLVAVCNDVKVKHLYSVSVDKSYLESEKYKLFKQSQYYYQTNYNNASAMERMLIKLSCCLGILIRKISDRLHRK